MTHFERACNLFINYSLDLDYLGSPVKGKDALELVLRTYPFLSSVPINYNGERGGKDYSWHPQWGMLIEDDYELHSVTHEFCHWLIAPNWRHQYVEYGLGNGWATRKNAPLLIHEEVSEEEEIKMIDYRLKRRRGLSLFDFISHNPQSNKQMRSFSEYLKNREWRGNFLPVNS